MNWKHRCSILCRLDSRNEVWHLQVTNHSKHAKKIRLWSYVEWCLWEANDDMTNFQRNYSTGRWKLRMERFSTRRNTESEEIITPTLHRANRFPVTTRAAMHSSACTTDWKPRKRFWQEAARTVQRTGGSLSASIKLTLRLKPGETKKINFILGYGENPPEKKFLSGGKIRKDEYEKVKSRFSSSPAVLAAFDAHKKYWDNLLSTYPGEHPRYNCESNGKYVEPVSMHGNVQLVPLGFAL